MHAILAQSNVDLWTVFLLFIRCGILRIANKLSSLRLFIAIIGFSTSYQQSGRTLSIPFTKLPSRMKYGNCSRVHTAESVVFSLFKAKKNLVHFLHGVCECFVYSFRAISVCCLFLSNRVKLTVKDLYGNGLLAESNPIHSLI